MGTSDSKNEMDWLGKVWRTDPKKCKGPVQKMKKIELDWFEKWERLTGKDGKVWLKKMGKCDSKNEKYWQGKVGRTDPKKWEGLTQKNETDWLGQVGRTKPNKWEDLTQKMRRADLEKRTNLKCEKDWLKKWEGLTLNMEGLSQSRGRSDSKKKGLVDTSQPSYIELHFSAN